MMASTVTSRDVQEIVSKLSSDKAKTREEGIKLLNTWLDGERSIIFCKYLSEKTALLEPNDIPHSETWPFIISMLIQCVSLEISSSKKRPPKLSFAKTLRIVVQRAEDTKFYGKNLPLSPVAKALFNHIWDVLKDVSSFQSEYAIILRHLLSARHYRFHMRKRIYCGLVRLYIEKVQKYLDTKSSGLSNPREEVFRCSLTLHSLIDNAPGDFPDDLREDIVNGFIGIFSHIRDEGKIPRKLIECINRYLSTDGPNVGSKALQIHDAIQQFVFRCWIATHDRSLKDALVLYARLQLNLTRGADDGGALLEQLVEVLSKELDYMSTSSMTLTWIDTTRDDKSGTLTSSQHSLLELSALVFCQACTNISKAQSGEKRARRQHAEDQMKDGLMKGKWSWHAAFCYLIRNYYSRIRKALIFYWFESISVSFETVINNANAEHAYDGLLWTLRSLQELSELLHFPPSSVNVLPNSSFPTNEFDKGWQKIWRCVIHSLPTFSNVTSVADAALLLAGSIILRDTSITVSQDVWNLRLFKCLPSISVLHFIACYFSRRGSQGDLRDALHLRQNLLRSVLALLNWKESSILNEHLVVLLPLTIYALCSGCAPLPLHVPEVAENWVKAEEHDDLNPHKHFELSVEMLAKIDDKPAPKVMQTEWYQGVHLPRKLRYLLLHEVQSHILEAITGEGRKKMLLSDIFFACALFSNLMHCSYSTSLRFREDSSLFISKLGYYMIELVDHAASIVEKTHNDINFSCLDPKSVFNSLGSVVSSINSFLGSPLFSKREKEKGIDSVLHVAITHSIERLLKEVAKVFDCCSDYGSGLTSGVDLSCTYDGRNSRNSYPSDSSNNTIVDMELDVGDSKEVDILALGGKTANGIVLSLINLKVEIVSFISSFFSVLPSMTWDILFNLAGKESNPSVLEALLLSLCQHPDWSSDKRWLDLVTILDEFVDVHANLRLQSLSTLDAVSGLVQSLLLLTRAAKDKHVASSAKAIASEGEVTTLGELVNKVSENTVFDWHGRSKLVDCICNFVLLKPEIGQSMIEKLLMMLRDPDYRVRLILARKICVLFQTWDGHDELLQDICSSFGAKLVVFSKEKVVTANEVLSAGPQARPLLETAVITLMHLALESEKIELEAVFMICAVAAIDPCQREIVAAILDNLSRHLQYSSREKYMEELIGPIIFCWVACGVSLVALVETRDLFTESMEPCNFMQYCGHWLLPALLVNEDLSNLNWVSKVASQPPAILVKSHFVHIFSVCMALHCSKKAGWQKGLAVLDSLILSIAEISENERDKLIKKHMVSIVNHLLSLAAASADPALPLFSRDTIKNAIQIVVDGFLEISSEEHPRSSGLVDKINIFRPNRVFMFIVEMHYKIAAAANDRHKCNRLAGVEVLIDLLEHRAGVSSTYNYLLNLVGQCIGQHALLDQGCRIISMLLKICKSFPEEDTTRVLGEQLPLLVSKLVPYCMPSESGSELSSTSSSEVLSLLHQLIVHSDPSFYEYIKELDLFPELDPFVNIWMFQKKLCLDYSPKSHLINLAKRSYYLPARILILSLKALHRKLFGVESCQGETNAKFDLSDKHWNSDQNIVHAVWALVQTCSLDDTSGFAALVSDFVSKIGIGDPHRVVFDLPGEFSYVPGSRVHHKVTSKERVFSMDPGTSEELLYLLMRILKKYLMDDSVKIIDIAAQALRGILSTEKGQRALLLFDSYERSLIEVHSKGINMDLVEKFLLDLERKSNVEAISLGNSTIWKTSGKTFEMWICPLVHVLIGYCNDNVLRLCQDIVLVKSEVAELLLPNVMVNLAGRGDLDVDLCKLISLQVQENIFTDSNTLKKSIKVMLDALNELRLCHVLERAATSSVSHKSESLKNVKPSSSGAKARSVPVRHKDRLNSSGLESSTFLWEKVYWLPIDYLVVAKSAFNCGSYFTAVMYVEHWCEEHFNSLTLGSPDFSHIEVLPRHIEILVSAVTQINEPDSLYGIIQSHKLTSQIIMFEHEGNWTKALEHYDLLLRSEEREQKNSNSRTLLPGNSQSLSPAPFCNPENAMSQKKPFKGVIRSLQQIGCTHVLDVYCQGLSSQKGQLQDDLEFTELQYEAAWRAGDWDFSILNGESNSLTLNQSFGADHFNQNLHSCFRALEAGDIDEFHTKLRVAKQELLLCICNASKESTEYIYSTIVKLQIFHHLGMAWELRWSLLSQRVDSSSELPELLSKPIVSSMQQLSWLSKDWNRILEQAQLHMNLLEPFIAFRRVLLQILNNMDSKMQHLLDSASTLRKGCRFSQAMASLHEFKSMCTGMVEDSSNFYLRGRLEEAKLLRAQGQHEMAINLAKYISQTLPLNRDASDVFRLLGKWLAETRSSNSRIVLEKYLKHAVAIADNLKAKDTHSTLKQCQMHFQLAHYTDALFRSYEDRLNSSEWQAAMHLRKLKTKELEALIKRLKSSSKGEKIEYSAKIQELQKQLKMDKEEDEKLQVDRDNFLTTALEGYKHCLVLGDKYDIRVVFRLVSLWFSLSSRPIVVNGMLSTITEVQSYKFIPLVYQIASRMSGTKDGPGPQNFQFALISLVKKMAIEHPYHTIFQLLALANGDRIKDKQRSRNSFVVDKEKKVAAENLLKELNSYHGAVITQMIQMVEIYIKLAELETKREDTNRRVALPRDIRGVRELELAPVITSNIPVDRSGQYPEGSFPHFRGLADTVTVMNGINAPKLVECLGSDGNTYRQLAKSGNDDLRQDAVMEQFFGLVNTFLQNHRDTRKRRLRIRTYKVVPFTPSAGVLEWVDGTVPLGEYLTGSNRNGGAHARYGVGDWMFSKCRQHMTVETDKRKAFEEVFEHFRPVMHYFFLERFLHPSDWFEKRLAYTRSVAASSMVGYIVGLGDRHAMNILIDQATAEVVHIDLGVAFEQGLMLKTPERVPFRLTRDIVDGMGITGVEGVFRRCCEETLSVMRTNKEALLTIVEVFIHDPLYKWALSPLKALQRQKETDYALDSSLEGSDDEYEGNKDAARALMRVKQKLDGYEDGEMRSVHGQVQQLIQDAIDPDRLCELFPGWAAWM